MSNYLWKYDWTWGLGEAHSILSGCSVSREEPGERVSYAHLPKERRSQVHGDGREVHLDVPVGHSCGRPRPSRVLRVREIQREADSSAGMESPATKVIRIRMFSTSLLP